GLQIFILGLGSKVLIANNVGGLWNDMAQIGYAKLSMPLAWLGLLSYSLQIYFDFNGYSLMAIGLGKMLGFDFPQNFNFPYISKSVSEYWKRWHITLSTWFKDYLYIPLGGNRKGKLRTFLNMFIVWSVTGLWHGASWNFVFWGIYFFVLLSLEKL
ncbi:MAG TPA: transcriptional regulator, partial [Lachnospiraceae bacterium]|nr:transcriptional regulator [Lachnospiraceae bacterium]